LKILAKLTGCTPRYLSGSLGDVHIYKQHLEQVGTVLSRQPYEACGLHHKNFKSLDELLQLTAKDFSLIDYKNHGTLKGKLTVGADDE
jgi:thymidylate synthase